MRSSGVDTTSALLTRFSRARSAAAAARAAEEAAARERAAAAKAAADAEVAAAAAAAHAAHERAANEARLAAAAAAKKVAEDKAAAEAAAALAAATSAAAKKAEADKSLATALAAGLERRRAALAAQPAPAAAPAAAFGTVIELRRGGAELREILSRATAANRAPVLVDFSAPWCGPCRMVRPALDVIAAERPGTAIVSVDTEATPDNAALAREAAITAFPTFHIYRDGGRVDDWRGADLGRIRAALDRAGSISVGAGGSAASAAASAPIRPAPPAAPPLAPAQAASGPMATAAASALSRLRAALPAQADFAAAVRALLTLVARAAAVPPNPAHRRIRTANAAFQSRLGAHDGGMAAMTSFGFRSGTDEATGEALLVMDDVAAADPQLPAVRMLLEQALRAADPAGFAGTAGQFPPAGEPLPAFGAPMPADFAAALAGAGGMGAEFPGSAGMGTPAHAAAVAAALQANPAARAAAAQMASNPAAMAAMMRSPQAQAMLRQMAGNDPRMAGLVSNPALFESMVQAAAPSLAAMLGGDAPPMMPGGFGAGALFPGAPPPTPPVGGAAAPRVDPAALAAALAGLGAGGAAQQQQQMGIMSEDEQLAEAIRRSLEDSGNNGA